MIIDDFILDENVQILSNYDFASEISVNILGTYFLSKVLLDLEELQANIENVDFDKTKSKKKKMVFYTPEYIQDILLKNTLGKCVVRKEKNS